MTDSDRDECTPISRFGVLSLDGGGIYGLCTAIMLRKLAERNESFLTPGNVDLYAGTSAGRFVHPSVGS